MRKNGNKSYYHYILENVYDDKPSTFEYFLTMKQLSNKLEISRFTIGNACNDVDYKMRKHKNIKLKRCYIPVVQEKELTRDELDLIRVKLY
tara:strand:+ start:883 stop:1155 length:273 start_codon:yes stop_codon:yes gene_type:complete